MEKYICVHGHFYQPPRENPWLEKIELQDSAYPYHDWNARITAECYGPNTASRILGPDLKIINITNNYSKISFNFGPTLLYSMETENPDVYKAIVEADGMSAERFSGHGSAIAQVYNHMIMPLANKRDKQTQALWGIKDFRRRFGREPEGMWLPETAVDTETLEVIAELGVKFTILAPRQAKRVKKNARGARWKDLSTEHLDTSVAYLCQLPSGRTINIFFYNGPVSHDVGFGNLLDNGEAFARRLACAFPAAHEKDALVHIATDGESYGHHHRNGDMALAYCLHFIEAQGLAKLTNYGEFLEKHPPETLIEIHENSSWSCAHGVERWRKDCGCNTGGHQGWTQAWRSHLREGIDWLRDRLAAVYGAEASKYLKTPWAARDGYIDVINDRSDESIGSFFAAHAGRELTSEEKVTALKLLELQRNAQLMYTSCGWFFDEISGIETVQVMQYASNAMQLAEEIAGNGLEKGFLDILEKAPGNVHGNGKEVYARFAKSARVDLLRVGAHHAISSLFQQEYSPRSTIYCYNVENRRYEKKEAGKLKLSIGETEISSRITRSRAAIIFAVLHLGEHSVTAGVKKSEDEQMFHDMGKEIRSAFEIGDIPQVIRSMDKHFGTETYSLWHIFRDEQRKLINQILTLTYEDIENSYRHIFEDNYNLMDFLRRLYMPLPKPLSVSAEFIINMDLKRVFTDSVVDKERLSELINTAQNLSINIDSEAISYITSAWVNKQMEELKSFALDTGRIEEIRDVLKILSPISSGLNLWKAQNIYFSAGKSLFPEMSAKADAGDGEAQRWVKAFHDLGNCVSVNIF